MELSQDLSLRFGCILYKNELDDSYFVFLLTLEGMGGGGGGRQSDPSHFFGLKFLFLDRLPKAWAQLFFVC